MVAKKEDLTGEDVRRLSGSLIKKAVAFAVVAFERMDDGMFCFAANTVNLIDKEDARHLLFTAFCNDVRLNVERLNKQLEEIVQGNRVRAVKEQRSQELKEFAGEGVSREIVDEPAIGTETLEGIEPTYAPFCDDLCKAYREKTCFGPVDGKCKD